MRESDYIGSIAIIGMSGRFPGANNLKAFWENLKQGKEGVTFYGEQTLLSKGENPSLLNQPEYVPACPALEQIDAFDPSFFQISPREAKELAPQLRLFLECTWEAFEHSGYLPEDYDGQIGVYAGSNLSQYWRLKPTHFDPTLSEILGNDKDYLASYISYRLNLKGPSVGIQTACSTSLVAISTACQALNSFQCEMAIAGGSAIRLPQDRGYVWEKDSILTPDGHCRPFDANAAGTLFGSGVGVVLLKRLDEALEDGDTIHAIIRGSAINNDGHAKVGFSAPSVEGQANVISLAQAIADVHPETIQYIEAHGTATPLGDPVEVSALTRAFREQTDKNQFCGIGSVKSNIGHLETAAGVAGLIKTVLALGHQTIPANLHFEQENPEIHFSQTPFYVVDHPQPWPTSETPRRAGVSSFGMGGTNAHVILEEAPQRKQMATDSPSVIIPLSAQTPEALIQQKEQLHAYFHESAEFELANVAFTLQQGRQSFAYRNACILQTSGTPQLQFLEKDMHAETEHLIIYLSKAVENFSLFATLFEQDSRFESYVRQVQEVLPKDSQMNLLTSDIWLKKQKDKQLKKVLTFVGQYALARLIRTQVQQSISFLSSGSGHLIAACLTGALKLESALTTLLFNKPVNQQHIEPTTHLWIIEETGEVIQKEQFISSQLFSVKAKTSANVNIHYPEHSLVLQAGKGFKSSDQELLKLDPFQLKVPEAQLSLHIAMHLWLFGLSLDWLNVKAPEIGQRIPLPTYPFQRQSYWIDEPTPYWQNTSLTREQENRPFEGPVDRGHIQQKIREFIGKALHVSPDTIEPSQNFLSMGADSLVFMESIQAIDKAFGVQLKIKDVFESLVNIDVLTDYIHERQKAKDTSSTESVVPEQRHVTSTIQAEPGWKIGQQQHRQLTSTQQTFLQEFIERYTSKTRQSKRKTQTNRQVLADVRTTAGYKQYLKELLYPITMRSAQGAYMVDIDDNHYLDITMGFGVYLFGHQPEFLHQALQEQLSQACPLGPENEYSTRVAQLIQSLAHVDRVAFFNSGTEAVMTAIRIARAYRQKDTIVMFKGSYHGHSDHTLGIGLSDQNVAPLSQGVPADLLKHLVILDYGDDKAISAIETLAPSLAAVLVEPVQSHFPNQQPQAFLTQLRTITQQHDVPLIFDEMITGFRVSAGGAQDYFDIQADLCTYGKIVGHGLPIGVVAGQARLMDYLDGGYWEYGDDSSPAKETIFYAGTFNKNPWSMAAACATLEAIRNQGDALYTSLNQKTQHLATTLNEFFAEEKIPMHIVHYASLFRFQGQGNLDLFFYLLIDKGIYVWEGRNCFLSTSHNEADIQHFIDCVKEAALQLRNLGFMHQQSDSIVDQATDRSISDISAPISLAQQQLLTLSQLSHEGTIAYNIYLTAKLEGLLNKDALQSALDSLVTRHESLRSAFFVNDKTQRYLAPQSRPIAWVDLSDREEEAKRDSISAWFKRENQHQFDLEQGYLLKTTILQLSAEQHLLVITTHHMIADGVSLNILMSDLLALYESHRQNEAIQLPDATPYSQWVNWLAQQDFQPHQQYWKSALQAPLPTLDIPRDHTQKSVPSFQAAVSSLTLGQRARQQLIEMAQSQQCSLFMLLFANYSVLLHRLSEQDDLIIGVPTAGRSMEGSETLVGYCTHLLPCRVHIDGETSFEAHLSQIKSTLFNTFEYQDYPFAEILNDLNLPYDQSQSPLITTTFNLDQPKPIQSIEALNVQLLPPPIRYHSFDLSLNVTDINDTLVIECKYHTALFEQARIDAMLSQYKSLLQQSLKKPSTPLEAFSLITPEHRSFIPDFTAPRQSKNLISMTELLVQQAAFHPGQIVLEDQDGFWGYQSLLDETKNRAAQFNDAGIQPNDIIVLAGYPCRELVATMLAVWWVGGIWMTLDDSIPQKRRQDMLDIADPVAWVSVGDAELTIDTLPQIKFSQHQGSLQSEVPPTYPCDPQTPAYLFFTSGSTGKPKAILGKHGGLTHFVFWQKEQFGIQSNDRVAQCSAMTFDAILRDIFLPLSVGATLFIPAQETRQNPQKFINWMGRHQISIVHTVPSVSSTWIDINADRAVLSQLRYVFFSGEPVSASLIEQWQTYIAADAHYILFYGVTEATMIQSYARVTDLPIRQNNPGFEPMSECDLYIEKNQQLCGIGEPGEIVIRTPYHSLGYYQANGEAPEAFQPHPHSYDAADHVYYTGDWGRLLPDGAIEVLGRRDGQVKLNGVRIELMEVKSALDGLSEVSQSWVALKTLNQQSHLVGYLVLNDPSIQLHDIRQKLSEQLPMSMLPSFLVPLDSLPLLPSGKVDSHRLPDPGTSTPSQPPRDDLERHLCQLWKDVLKQEISCVATPFFELGGNSISATLLLQRLQQDFACELTLKHIFDHPTIAAFASWLSLSQQSDALRATSTSISTNEVSGVL
ncbi:aminotransferase class III-fold pyridoxal phosphate-dependent enzyme [Algicola sagamiensis]|uniref:aminotransferase class III-fold pyridoxal phosphate-dependent enzyme n=1 Tax=Algicola sagamiensis TaxID=163869 RepID=UPI00036DA870|nr:aminotransferase class III-fold pyridoxal phosphate-dependent enzyme [Algicola sagamiensis]